jgi:3-oxoacyl-[acyl-carrier-protein] synthase II
MLLKRAVITGLGAITPIGNTIPEYWGNLINGKSGAAIIARIDAAVFKTRFACEVKNFDPLNFFERKDVKRFDRYAQFAMIAADEAIADSGLDAESVDKELIGVLWASGIGGLEIFQEEVSQFARSADGVPRFNPFFIPKMIADIAAGQISMKHGFKGPNFAPVAACASSTISIAQAFDLIRLGKATAVVAGGSEAAITAGGIGGFNSMKAMSERNDSPETASRPYDKDRDGFVMGEGGGALIIEELEHALARGAKIYAEVLGSGLSADAYHLTAPHPDGLGAAKVMEYALKDSSIKATDINYINTHGTSTPLGDNAELLAIKKVFGGHAYNMNISATKSMTGHLLGGAGAIEAIACVLSIVHDIVPPTINHFTDDPEIDSKLNLTFNTAQKRVVNAALSNTFGFGGHNAAAVFSKFAK